MTEAYSYGTYRVTKHESSDGAKTFVQWRRKEGVKNADANNPHHWEKGVHGIERRLLDQDELPPARSGATVLIPEGEKSTYAVRSLGFHATTSSGGSSTPWSENHNAFFAGNHVVILADDDPPGQKHALDKAHQLVMTAASVKIITFTGLRKANGGDGADICEWIEAGGTRNRLLEIIQESPLFGAEQVSAFDPGLDLTDMGNARSFVRLHGRDVRFCHEWGQWIVWNGKCFSVDGSNTIMEMAKATIRTLLHEAADLTDEDQQKKYTKHALNSAAEKKLRAMVSLATSDPRIAVQSCELDSDPLLFNAGNGTIDLRSACLREHRREDLLTKVSPYEFDADARAPRWELFLHQIMGGNHALISFLQRAFGYSMTGETKEQVLFFCYGLGRNGKTTLLETVRHVLGDYGQSTSPETLMVKPRGAISNDVAALVGVRYVPTSEVEDGKHVAESLVKQLTGGDTMYVRKLYHEGFEFKPNCKIWIASNHKPRIVNVDLGIWRRIKLVPFDVTISEEAQDVNLSESLHAEGAGILRWLVEGCREWQNAGIRVPDEVTKATEQYKTEMDTLALFIEDRCVVDSEEITSSSNLFLAYESWCEETKERPLARNKFGSKIQERGYRLVRTTFEGKQQRVFYGIRVNLDTVDTLGSNLHNSTRSSFDKGELHQKMSSSSNASTGLSDTMSEEFF